MRANKIARATLFIGGEAYKFMGSNRHKHHKALLGVAETARLERFQRELGRPLTLGMSRESDKFVVAI